MPLKDHSLRYAMTNELHARPFPVVTAPCRAVFLAIKQPVDAASRDRSLDLAHLIDLLDRYGEAHPQPGATHYFGTLGKHRLKWESHTEFVTYTLLSDGVSDRPFDGQSFRDFPQDWLDNAPGERITSALIRVEENADEDDIAGKLKDWFVRESLAVSVVLDGSAVVASDFRIDPEGHVRLAVFAKPGLGAGRTGRILQRLSEIETYKTMSMLGLAMSRDLGAKMGAIEENLSVLVGDMGSDLRSPEDALEDLLAISSKLEGLASKSSFRFGATGAYSALVNQRVEVLREARFQGRQTMAEFMMRRFDPAMRTVSSSEQRLVNITDRSLRAANLLRTRVDVERSAQNQKLLESMDQRAHVQLKLQRTVEGLSVVAISYYAITVVLYLLGPLGYALELSKTWQAAIVTPPVLLAVWLVIKRIHKSMQ